jgi:hypothetical protein
MRAQISAMLAACVVVGAGQPEGAIDEGLRSLHDEAARLRTIVETDAVRAWLDEVASLTPVETRTIHYMGGEEPAAYTSDQFEALDEAAREGFRPIEFTTERYYSTFYGSALAYARALDVAAQAGIDSWDGKRVCDMGYGQITQLRMLAACGTEAVGIEVQPILDKLYSFEGDQGEFTGVGGKTGSVRLVHGYWPAGEGVASEVGGGFDLFMSRNTLKRGYVNPLFDVPERQRVKLGVSDEAFLAALHDALKPGGLAMIYNIGLGEAGTGESYVGMNDIHDPFARETWEAAGFEVVVYDKEDSGAARAVGRALQWDQGEQPMDLEQLYGRYTIARRVD